MIEGLFAVRKAGFETSGFPAIQSDLDLIESEDQITHEVMLDAADLNAEMQLDVFKFDKDYEEHEKEYEAMKKEILGMENGERGETLHVFCIGEESGKLFAKFALKYSAKP